MPNCGGGDCRSYPCVCPTEPRPTLGPSDLGVVTVCTRLHNYPQPTLADWIAADPRLTNCPVCGALEFGAEAVNG